MSESPPIRRIFVVQNPVSGLRARHRLVGPFLDTLKGSGAEVKHVRTEGPGHAAELVREAGRLGFSAVVIAGGDGTVNEALAGLPPGGPALGVFPTGTASILARELSIPFSPAAAARVVVAGRRRKMDVSTANGRRFLMVVGVGWDAHVVSEVDRIREGNLGMHRYLLPILRATIAYRWPEIRIRRDDETVERPARLAFAANIRNYAAWFRIAPEARPDDGRLDFLVLREARPRDCVRFALNALTGTLPGLREAEYTQGRSLTVTADEPVPWQMDGDPGGVTPVVIRMLPDPVEVIVP
jgi:YegS/Rv2252/BmrU family lipid kinase